MLHMSKRPVPLKWLHLLIQAPTQGIDSALPMALRGPLFQVLHEALEAGPNLVMKAPVHPLEGSDARDEVTIQPKTWKMMIYAVNEQGRHHSHLYHQQCPMMPE